MSILENHVRLFEEQERNERKKVESIPLELPSSRDHSPLSIDFETNSLCDELLPYNQPDSEKEIKDDLVDDIEELFLQKYSRIHFMHQFS